MANFTWDYWVLQSSYGANGYEATGSVTASRDTGSDVAVVTANMTATCLGGDVIGWTMHLKVGNTEYTQASSESSHTINVGYVFPALTEDISVGTDAGTLAVEMWMTLDGWESYSGGTSEVKTATLSYGSKGASDITSAADHTLGRRITVIWTPLASDFKYKIKLSLGSWSVSSNNSAWTDANSDGFIVPGSTSEYTCRGYTLPDDNATLLGELANSKTGTMIVTLYSYDADGNQLGTSTSTFTVTVPSSVRPTIDSWSVSGQDSTFNEFITGYSSLTLTCTASGVYGSTPVRANFQVGTNKTYRADFTESNGVYTATVTTSALTVAGSRTLTTTVVDSRGISSASRTDTITVYSYHPPQIDNIELSTSDTATTVTIDVSGSIASVNSLNDKYLRIMATRISDSSVVTIYAKTAQSSYTISRSITTTISDIETESYLIAVTLFDSKYTNGVTKTARTGIVCVSRLAGGHGLAIFREATSSDSGRVGIKGYVRMQGNANDDTQTGYMNAGCDGIFDYRTDGTPVFAIARASSNGSGGIWLYNTASVARGYLSAGSLVLRDSDSVTRMVLASTSGGTVNLFDSSGVLRLHLGGDGTYSPLVVNDSDGNGVAAITTDGAWLGSFASNCFLPHVTTILSEVSIAGDGYKTGSVAYTATDGYRPIGIIGWNITTTDGVAYARYMNVFMLNIGWDSDGNPGINYAISNTGTNTRSVTLTATVLEFKCPS